jgi:hypothetical protein
MAQKSKEKAPKGMKRDKFGLPDPLHFDLPQHHGKLLELLYLVVIVGAILSIIMLNIVGVLNSEERGASLAIVIFLSIILAALFIEKSIVERGALKPQRPGKSSS